MTPSRRQPLRRRRTSFSALLFASIALLWTTSAAAHLDLVFLLDTTGSMGGELHEAKTRVREIVSALQAARPSERVRTGVVAYRDRGDDYVTRKSDLTEDVSTTNAFLDELTAGGGGDGPEDVIAGLVAALNLNWDLSSTTERQVFLIADAQAHRDYETNPSLDEVVSLALKKKVVLHALGCRSLSARGIAEFRALARRTEGQYQHIGRVSVGRSRSLVDAIVAAAGAPDPQVAFETARLLSPEQTRGLHLSAQTSSEANTNAPAVLAVRLLATKGETDRACHAIARAPEGMSFATAPKVFVHDDKRVDVSLTLERASENARDIEQTFALPQCTAVGATVNVRLGGVS